MSLQTFKVHPFEMLPGASDKACTICGGQLEEIIHGAFPKPRIRQRAPEEIEPLIQKHLKPFEPTPYAGLKLARRYAFRIYPLALRGLYFDCLVFPTREEMRAFFNSEHGQQGDHFEACFSCFDIIDFKPKPGTRKKDRQFIKRKKSIFGAMGFHAGNLRQEVISHESLHAAASYLRRAQESRSGIDFAEMNRSDEPGDASPTEEMLALLTGKIARLITNRFHALGFYR